MSVALFTLFAAAVACGALPARAQAPSNVPLPGYDGNCTGCSTAGGWYCGDTDRKTCWKGPGCGGDCRWCIANFVHHECPLPGQVPQYNDNCTACLAAFQETTFYCADTTSRTCWAEAGCGGNCTACVEMPRQCPRRGAIPQFDYHCRQCVSPSGGNAFYCADVPKYTCWLTDDCGGDCVDCVAEPQDCPPSQEIPQFNGNCSACTSGPWNGMYCIASRTCWDSAVLGSCGGGCPADKCVFGPTQCPPAGSVPRRRG